MSIYSEIQRTLDGRRATDETMELYPYLAKNKWELGKTAKELGCSKQALRGAVARCSHLASMLALHGRGRGRPRKSAK